MRLRTLIIVVFFTNAIFSQSFQDTQGKLEISNTGQASYTLPIAMPPSINNVGPVINLVYVSGQNSGIVGQGWNINTISSITRMSTRNDIEGYRDGVDFDADDKLSIDGQRLLLKTGTYWSDGSTYETEVQSNIKIELKGVGSDIFFIVTATDGSITWYGQTFSGDSVKTKDHTSFYIKRYRDINGNEINYNYTGFGSLGAENRTCLYISSIEFSKNINSNPTPLNSIDFFYKTSKRYEVQYINGEGVIKSQILDKIEVKTNNLLFKKYQISHILDTQLGYERVSQIQEFNGAGEVANPVVFEYKSTLDNVTENGVTYTDALDLSTSPDLSGDFDGDGKLDFVSGNTIYTKLFQGTGQTFQIPNDGFYKKISGTTLLNNKLNQKQSLIKIKENLDSTILNIYNTQDNYLNLGYSKSISMSNAGICSDYCAEGGSGTCYETDEFGNTIVVPCNTNSCPNPEFLKNSNEYLEGDFNGDGISEILILSYSESNVYAVPFDPINKNVDFGKVDKSNQQGIVVPENDCVWTHYKSNYPSEFRLVDLNPSSSVLDNTKGNFVLQNIGSLIGDKHHLMDFNSDGKTDILVLNNNQTYKIVSFKQLLTAPWVELEVIGQGTLDAFSPSKQILFGDYNGDGKHDIMLPDADGNGCSGCNLWHIYYSNPKSAGGEFFTKKSYNIVEYRPSSGNDYETQWHNSSYYAMDVNKDGKSDIVRIWTSLWQYSPFWDPKDIDSSWSVNTYINNIGVDGNINGGIGFNYNYSSPSTHDNNDNSRPIPLVGNYKYKGMDSDLLMIRFHGGGSFDKTVTFIDFKKDFCEDNLLQKVTQSNGAIVDEIIYDAMVPSEGTNGLGNQNEFYSSTESLEYPLIELKQMASNKLVSKLKNTSLGVVKFQDFKYHGLSADLNGIGVIGFKKTARSSWYRNSLDKKNWNSTENNMLQRGATLRTFSILLNGSQQFNFGTIYTDLVNKTENTFTESTDPISKRYSILLNTQKTTDYLTNIVTQKIYNSYSSDFLLPLSVTTNTLLGSVLHGSITTVTNYENNITGSGSNYYIGRPSEVNTTKTIYVNTLTGSSNTKTSNEKYFYTNGNLTQTEKKSNGSTETLVETFVYSSNGLLQNKTINATGTTAANAVTARTTTYTYDATSRFIKTSTDSEGLITENLTYHNLYGTVLTQKNPYNQITTSEYDNWGKRTRVTDFLGKSINYTYTRTGNIYNTTQVGDDGSSSIIESDALARQIKKGIKDINGNWIYSTTEYDYLGRKLKDSEPFLSTTSASLFTVYEYDDYNRPIKTTSPTGKIIATTYSGLTVSAFDSVMTKTKTMNANGQIISATDNPGGTIIYKYDANNNLVESDYDGIKITMLYDNWGRKQQLTDSSAGTYTYSYNAFGETKIETTPKGSTTYTLSPVGKVLTKAVIGDGTSITSTYTYDATNKWLTNLAVVNPNDGDSNYAYTYDTATKQINSTIETLYPVGSTTPFVTFTKQLTYDAYGRVFNETSTALSHGKSSSKTITHTYKNGLEWQLLEGTAVKWQADAVNQRGQLTNVILGNGIAITNSYDTFGYATQNKHLLGTTNVMTLNNVFDPVLANLTSRSNSMFDVNESFTYDSQDRLISWDGSGQNLLTLPFNTTTDGFSFTSTSTKGSVTNSAGTLKIVLKAPSDPDFPIAAQRNLALGLTSGNRIRVKATITNKTGTPGVIVNAVMVETDPIDPNNYAEFIIGSVENGTFDANYTISDFVTNPTLKLRFVVSSESPEGSNGGGIVLPNSTFYVDNLKIDNVSINTQSYDNRGRITENVTGQYNYTNTSKPYQNTSVITSAQANTYYTGRPLQSISYNAFKAPIQIEEQGVDKISFGYNAMLQRSVMYYGNTDNDKLKRPYRKYFSADGSMEIKATFAAGSTTTPTSVEIITYIGGDAYSASALIKSDGTTQNYFYLHRDYQGSIMAITNATGGVVEKRLYNPWGEIVKIQDGANNNLTKLTFFDRGYTGHQHLETVGLIHMNGRLYDSKLHRFLQPDNFVQDPHNTQSFNRYGYCWNNPLKYTDKNGEELVSAILIGAGVALAAYLTTNLVNGTPITLKGAIMATVVGAVSGAVTFGIGSWTQSIGNFALKATTQALAHGSFQGTLSGFQGGGFWTGAASGALSSIASSVFAGGMNTKVIDGQRYNIAGTGWAGAGKFAKSTFGMISFGTVMGGAGAELTGGNFWKGAVTGLVVSSLNHAMPQHNKELDQVYSDRKKFETTDFLKEIEVIVNYEYTIKDGNYKVLTAKVSTAIDIPYFMLDSYKENTTARGATIDPSITIIKNSDQFVFKSMGTFHSGSIESLRIDTFKTEYSFLGHINIKNLSLSTVHISSNIK